jgi:hypothetical protein
MKRPKFAPVYIMPTLIVRAVRAALGLPLPPVAVVWRRVP